jgi:hypothetical protein
MSILQEGQIAVENRSHKKQYPDNSSAFLFRPDRTDHCSTDHLAETRANDPWTNEPLKLELLNL